MKICVQGLWHLGSVTAACLAASGHEVIGYDPAEATVAALREAKAPVFEPGLRELLQAGIESERLRFTSKREDARKAEVLWVAFDTPVDAEDNADTRYVIDQVAATLPHLSDGCVVVISSQLPVGSIADLERHAAATLPHLGLFFACAPENLRLGKAIDVFRNPDRIIVGVRDARSRAVLTPLLASISARIEWMSVESAEMTKHAINAFLASSVVFVNEIATLCETVGANAKEVERGLKTESRIGPKAYLAPGAAFAGGTLARDVAFLGRIAASSGNRVPLIDSIRSSNEQHKGWIERKLQEALGELGNARIAIWGLTYKAGTDTLRRSAAMELCHRLIARHARVVVHDPTVNAPPAELGDSVIVAPDPIAAVQGADALAVCTEWPEYRNVSADEVVRASPGIAVVDPNRFLAHFDQHEGITYSAVGTPSATRRR